MGSYFREVLILSLTPLLVLPLCVAFAEKLLDHFFSVWRNTIGVE